MDGSWKVIHRAWLKVPPEAAPGDPAWVSKSAVQGRGESFSRCETYPAPRCLTYRKSGRFAAGGFRIQKGSAQPVHPMSVRRRNLAALALIAALFLSHGAGAAVKKTARGKNEGARTDRSAVQAVKAFDKDRDGQLDGEEKEALRSAFKSGDKNLSSLDTNRDGDLDENEMAAVSIQKSAKGKKKKKKSAAPA